jgi:thiol-disulfide isomerase/thioredoxin
MNRLEGAEQEPFALSFTEELALEAVAAGEPAIARGAYQTLLDRFRASDTVRDKAPAELARLDLIGRPVPQFEVRDLARETITADTYKGKYVLIDVWATWCAPCLAELPRLLSLEATYRDRGLVVIGLSLDESVEGLRDFVAARAIPWRQVHQATSGGDLAGALRITNLPCSILIQPDGTIARLDLRGEALERFLADTFAPKDSPEAKTRSAAPNEEEP